MATPAPGLILIVEADADLRHLLEEALRPFKAELRLAASGDEALEMLAVNRFRLVLLDLDLPVIDGLAVLETLERKHAEIPVIVLADDASAPDATAAEAHGAAAVIEKPLTASRVRMVVRDQLHRRDPGTGNA